MKRKRYSLRKSDVIYCILPLLLTVQSCVSGNFVGGTGSLISYPIEANYDKVIATTDTFVAKNAGLITREFDGSGYDKGKGRKYRFINDSIFFSVRFFGENTGWNGKPNYSEISVRFIQVNNVPFNPGQNTIKEKKELYEKSVKLVEENFIKPIKLAIKKEQ